MTTTIPGGARRFGRALQEIPGTWRRSLQLRVVTGTLVLSMVITGLLGWVLETEIKRNLVDAKETSSLAQVRSGVAEAKKFLSTDPNVRSGQPAAGAPAVDGSSLAAGDLTNLVTALCSGGGATTYQVLITSETLPVGSATCGPGIESVPAQLKAGVEAMDPATARIKYTPTTLEFDSGPLAGTPNKAGLIFGQQIAVSRNAEFQLYYTFPFDNEAHVLVQDSEVIALSGALLILALVGIAWLVTRQVVDPVRKAAGIAERLADGRLDERMRVRGEDDLARLASSFNKMASNLQNQIRRLEELSRVQRRFVSDVSHELRTPLTTVRMAADVLHDAREDFAAPASRSAELLQTQLDRFEELLGDLLEISRFDAGAAVLEAEPVDLRNLIERVASSNSVLAERRGCEVQISAPDTACIAEIDPRRIERILRNLLVNSIEHSEGRPVVVKVATSEEAVAVAIRDYGVGLRPGESSLVFGRFWRADPARARTTGGTGLGLAISLEDARLHHGWLQAWGEPGGGSQFRLTLPRAAGSELLRSPIPLEPEDSRHHKRQAEAAHVATAAAAAKPAVRDNKPDLTGLSGPAGTGKRDA